MPTPDDERDVYFFMAYLAQQEGELDYFIPLERDEFELSDRPGKFPGARELKFRMGVTFELTIPIAIPFTAPLSPAEIKELAEELVTNLECLPCSKNELADTVFELQESAAEEFRRLKQKKTQLEFIRLDFDLQESIGRELCFRLHYRKLGTDAKPVEESVLVENDDNIRDEIGAILEEQKNLAKRAREIAKEEADGAIDVVLASRLERHGIALEQIVKSPEELRRDPTVQLPDGEIRLFWRDGILTANMALHPGVEWVGGAIKLQSCPTTLEGDLEGRPVSEFLTHEDLPDDLTVISGNGRPSQPVLLQTGLPFLMFDKAADITS